jgi:hypothetical protein
VFTLQAFLCIAYSVHFNQVPLIQVSKNKTENENEKKMIKNRLIRSYFESHDLE